MAVGKLLELREAVSERWRKPPTVLTEFRKARRHESYNAG